MAGTPAKPPYDIVNNYNWTVSQSFNARKIVPYIRLIEYRQEASAIEQSITFWYGQYQQAKEKVKEGFSTRTSDDESPYKNLYIAKETGNEYYQAEASLVRM